MKNIQEIQENVDLVELDGRSIYLIGTAHVSASSAELVEEIIRRYEPDSVCVELCEPRLQSIQNPQRWRETDIFEVIKSGKTYVLMAQLILASFQKRLAEQFGIEPGAEMKRAISVTEELGAELVEVDREIKITLRRAWAKAGFWSMCKVLSSLVASLFSGEEISEQEIEELKKGNALSAIMSEFSDFLPGVKVALIDERDEFMAGKIAAAPGQTVVAVLGAGHIPGIKRIIGDAVDFEALEQLPPPSKVVKSIAWGVPTLILCMFVYGFFVSGAETSMEMFGMWFLANGIPSAIGVAIALGHPLTILTAFVVAPFTSLNPTIAAGWVCGLLEAWIRKPRVKDLETIADDIATVKGFWTNRVSRILLVIVLANLGSILGTLIGSVKVASLL